MKSATNMRELPTQNDIKINNSLNERNVLFQNFYQNHKAFINNLSNKSSNNDTFFAQDIRQELNLALWECTNKYLNEKNKKGENYYNIFPNFEKFAVHYIKYKIKNINYKNKLNKISGKINDTRSNREIYFKNCDKNQIFNENIVSINDEIKENENNENNHFIDIISSRSCEGIKDQSILDIVSDKQIKNTLNEVTSNYLNNLKCKIKKEILISRKLTDLFFCFSKRKKSLKILSKNFKISIERVRQISELEFEKYYTFVKKNLNSNYL